MQDDVTNPVADNEVVQPEVAADNAAEIEIDAGDEEIIQPAEEDIEVEREGKKYRIPKALEKELMLNADYTRKTQTLAEERKAVEAQRELIRQQAEVQQEFIKDIAKLHAVEDRLAQYEKLDWATLRQNSPDRANALFQEMMLLDRQRQTLGQDLNARQQQRQLEQQQETAKRIEQGRATLAERIPNWNQETAAKLVEFGTKEFGFSTEELTGIVDPRAVEALYYARIGKEFITKQRAAASKPQQPEIVPTPTVPAKRAAPTTNLYAIKDPERWAEIRNKQEAARRRR